MLLLFGKHLVLLPRLMGFFAQVDKTDPFRVLLFFPLSGRWITLWHFSSGCGRDSILLPTMVMTLIVSKITYFLLNVMSLQNTVSVFCHSEPTYVSHSGSAVKRSGKNLNSSIGHGEEYSANSLLFFIWYLNGTCFWGFFACPWVAVYDANIAFIVLERIRQIFCIDNACQSIFIFTLYSILMPCYSPTEPHHTSSVSWPTFSANNKWLPHAP